MRPRSLSADPPRSTSPRLAALLSALLPGLGQIYEERWVRGLLMLLLPAFVLALGGTFVAIADPLTALVIRYATVVTFLVIAALLVYHLAVVADAFAGGLAGGLRSRRVADYAALALVSLALAAFYGTVYRQSAAWAALAAKVFEPIARQAASPGDGASAPAPGWTGTERLNVLVLGIDSRSEDDPFEQNTDTIIVLSLDPLNKTGTMLSIPRDTLVNLPGHGADKINAAYAYGGPSLSQRAVEDLLGIQLHAYALVNFDAFVKTMDGVGGVVVDAKRPIRDEEYPTADFGVERINILAGPQLMQGELALRYARSRHDSNDFSRARRQQEVLFALRARLAEGNLLLRLPVIVDGVGPAVKTNFDPGNIPFLARAVSGLESSAIRSEVLLPCELAGPHCEISQQNGATGYYLIPDLAKVRDLAAQLFYDPRVRRDGARLEIRGAGARSAVTNDVADRLEARAFAIALVSDGPSSRSAVLLRNEGKRYTAEQVAKQLGLPAPQAAPARDAGDADVVVLVGSDFRGFASDRGR